MQPNNIHLVLELPDKPSTDRQNLDTGCNPKRQRQVIIRAPVHPTSNNRTSQETNTSANTPIALDILGHTRSERGIGRNIVENTGENRRRQLIEATASTRSHLSTSLEREEEQRDQRHEDEIAIRFGTGTVAVRCDDGGLNQDSGDNDAECLCGEGGSEGETLLCSPAGEVGEDKAADDKGAD